MPRCATTWASSSVPSLTLTPAMSPRLAAARPLLGPGMPDALQAIGDPAILETPGLLGLFCSRRLPPGLVLPTYDLARALRDARVPLIGGFHAPMEREALPFLLRGTQPVIHVVARGLARMRLSQEQRTAIEEHRLLLLSPFGEGSTRSSASLAHTRNRLVAALAQSLLVIHAQPGGQVEALCRECFAWGKPVYALPSQANAHLLALGASPWALPSGGPGAIDEAQPPA